MRTGAPLGEVAVRFTNLHRRFGFGDPDRGRAPDWARYAGRLDQLATIEDRTAWTVEFFAGAPEEARPADQHPFGCFACEAPSESGVVRIHFTNQDNDGLSPLHRSKIGVRRRELAAMFAFVDRSFAGASSVRGISWLYHLDAYRRLFPPEYAASPVPADRVRLCGSSSWGQFIRHDGSIKPALRDAFLGRLDSLDIAAPWRGFPLPAIVARAPMAAFRNFYGLVGIRPEQ